MRQNIHIENFIRLDNWLEVDARQIELVPSADCLCCREGKLVEIVRLREEIGEMMIRLGCCRECGYVGYIDKPSQDWIQRFYDDTWDTASATENKKDLVRSNHSFVVDYFKELSIPAEAAVFDVGCGYGTILWQLKEAGYRNLYGIEHSTHRAAFAEKSLDVPVSHLPYASDHLAEFKRHHKTYDVIYCKSVLEHMYDPNEFFRTSAALQKEGGYIMVMVPDAEFETALTKLFFIPHLHSFSKASFDRLARRHGYRVRMMKNKGAGLHMIAQKVASDEAEEGAYPDFLEPQAQRAQIGEEFYLDAMRPGVPYYLWSHKRDRTTHGLLPRSNVLGSRTFVAAAFALALSLPAALGNPLLRIVLGIPRVSKILRVHTDEKGLEGDAPIVVIQKNLRLMYK